MGTPVAAAPAAEVAQLLLWLQAHAKTRNTHTHIKVNCVPCNGSAAPSCLAPALVQAKARLQSRRKGKESLRQMTARIEERFPK
eukprot:scaffold175819_cov19-Tisochrysis_lutea.AAC.1